MNDRPVLDDVRTGVIGGASIGVHGVKLDINHVSAHVVDADHIGGGVGEASREVGVKPTEVASP
ncbi:hypothetical protein ACIBW9_04165 [Streptomyces sp. NPDC049541]|uniref:hypothetical protein n=1 Tax=Streptomyces sp. NPDC049541 TaxID=3365594 RepID=UPI0037BC6BEC